MGWKELLKYHEETKKELQRLRSENEKWCKEWSSFRGIVSNGKRLEKLGFYKEAINYYGEAVFYAENSEKLNINNYYEIIHRIVILYGKTKQREELKTFLIEKINKYPHNSSYLKIKLSKLTKNK